MQKNLSAYLFFDKSEPVLNLSKYGSNPENALKSMKAGMSHDYQISVT